MIGWIFLAALVGVLMPVVIATADATTLEQYEARRLERERRRNDLG